VYKYKYKYKYGRSHQEAQNTIQVQNNNYVKVYNYTSGVILRVKSDYILNGKPMPNDTDSFHSYSPGFPESHYTRTIDFPEGASNIKVEVEAHTGLCIPFTGKCIWSRRCFWENVELPACFRVDGSIYTGDCYHIVCE
jgi:hypothetical protein